jgi:hypothetical protein
VKSPPENCPNCGADVPRNAKACPACGADENTGWSDETHIDGLDLPDEPFNYDDFVSREFGPKSLLPRGITWFWWIVALILAVIFVAVLVRFR